MTADYILTICSWGRAQWSQLISVPRSIKCTGLIGGWEIYFQDSSFICLANWYGLLAGSPGEAGDQGLLFLSMSCWASPQHGRWRARSSVPGKQGGRKVMVFLWSRLGSHITSFPLSSVDRDSHRSPPIFKRRRMLLHLLMEEWEDPRRAYGMGATVTAISGKYNLHRGCWSRPSLWQMVATGTRERLQRGWRGVNRISRCRGGKMGKSS